LSIKRLLPDPWVKAASKFKVGDLVKGEITKITPFGAFVSLDEEIDGLVHVSELSEKHVMDPGQIVELGKRYDFKIISIEPENHRLGLSLKAVNSSTEKAEEKTEDKKDSADAEEKDAEESEETAVVPEKKPRKSSAKSKKAEEADKTEIATTN